MANLPMPLPRLNVDTNTTPPSIMPSQSGMGEMAFSILPEVEQQHFRLLELPPELLDILTSDNPPILQLKSALGPPGRETSSHNAVLCTPTQTFSLRQVNHSNSVYLVQPTTIQEQQQTSNPARPPDHALQAVAQTTSTLEPTPQPFDPSAGTPFPRSLLPVYHTSSSISHVSHSNTAITSSKEGVFAHIPLGERECEAAWSELACFQLALSSLPSSPSGCFIPSAKARARVWKAILDYATEEGWDLTTASLSSGQIETLLAEVGEREEVPTELVSAVLDSVSEEREKEEHREHVQVVDREKCVRLVGINLLESTAGAIASLDFLREWRDALPEKWRGEAQLALLKPYVLVDDGGNLRYCSAMLAMSEDNAAAAPEAKASLGAKRKWHEKFRESKKSGSYKKAAP